MSDKEKNEVKKQAGQLDFTESQLLEIQQYLESKRQLLKNHPESKDYAAIWSLQQYIIKRLQELAWQQYVATKGIEILRV